MTKVTRAARQTFERKTNPETNKDRLSKGPEKLDDGANILSVGRRRKVSRCETPSTTAQGDNPAKTTARTH